MRNVDRLLVTGLLIVAAPACHKALRDAPAPGTPLNVGAYRRAGPDTVVYRRVISRAGQDSGAGTRTVVLRMTSHVGSTPLFEVEQRFPARGGEIVDTAVAEGRTLRAVSHHSHQPTRTMHFAFVGSDAQGTVAAGDSVQPVRQALGGPIFDSNILDLVVAALPLRPGFTADLPFFIYERGGRVVMPVAVRERATVVFPALGVREAWVVAVGVPGAPATVWVDARTRAVLRVRYDISAGGFSFTDERITGLHG